jgi:hypothetical protein
MSASAARPPAPRKPAGAAAPSRPPVSFRAFLRVLLRALGAWPS